MARDAEYEDLLPLLSVPAEQHDPTGLTRRRFLQGTLLAAGATGLTLATGRGAFGATPVGSGEGILVVVMLGGGNDGLNTLAPISGTARSRYDALRGSLAIPAAELLPAAGGWGFHPRLARLSDRYDTGRVAVVQGVGQPANDLSHFTSMATWMAGTQGTSRASGWLGRFLDGVTEFDSGLRGATFSSSVPLHLLGQQAKVTALPDDGGMWGADPSEAWEARAFAAVQAFGDAPTGLSQWGDRVAATGRAAIGMAQTAATLYEPEVTTRGLVKDLTLAARLINANLGVRVVGVSVGSFDTHAGQAYDHGELLEELDTAIEAFFTTLGTAWRDQTTLATFSEFGRRPEANDSGGTDHGTAGVMLVVGENVKGGLVAEAPSLTTFDSRGNFVPTVDFRSVYATLLDDWLDADLVQVLGGSFEQLDLFTNVPGGPRVVSPPPPPPNPAAPFPDWTSLVRQQYADLILTATPAADRVAAWVSKLQSGATTPVDLIVEFVGSTTPAKEVAPVYRAYHVCLGKGPTFSALSTRVAQLRSSGLRAVATSLVGSSAFKARHGSMDVTTYVRWLYRTVLGTTPSAERLAYWRGQLTSGAHTRGSILAHFLVQPAAVARWDRHVRVSNLYVGMLHREPSSTAWSKRMMQLASGTPYRTLVAEFFGLSEYKARFT